MRGSGLAGAGLLLLPREGNGKAINGFHSDAFIIISTGQVLPMAVIAGITGRIGARALADILRTNLWYHSQFC